MQPDVHPDVTARVEHVLRERLNLEVPARDTDLLEQGILDSLLLIDLLMQLETEFALTISLDDLEIDAFRSVGAIAKFVADQGGTGP